MTPGASAWFDRGFITYTNESKTQMLGVAPAYLRDFGAVSEPVARSMALGALTQSSVQVAVAVTGVAGPDGGTGAKPVGTVCFAWAIRRDRDAGGVGEDRHARVFRRPQCGAYAKSSFWRSRR